MRISGTDESLSCDQKYKKKNVSCPNKECFVNHFNQVCFSLIEILNSI